MVQETFSMILQKFDALLEVSRIELREIQHMLNSNPKTLVGSSAVKRVKQAMKHITEDSRMQQQIIPNVARIKVEKVRALFRQQARQEFIEQAMRRKKKPNLAAFDFEGSEADRELKQKGHEICPWSYYMENLFSRDDLYLYRGVVKFYAGKYSEAAKDFKLAGKVKRLNKRLDSQNNGGEEECASDSEEDYGFEERSDANS